MFLIFYRHPSHAAVLNEMVRSEEERDAAVAELRKSGNLVLDHPFDNGDTTMRNKCLSAMNTMARRD